MAPDRSLGWVLLSVALITVAGCGGDDKKNATSGSGSTGGSGGSMASSTGSGGAAGEGPTSGSSGGSDAGGSGGGANAGTGGLGESGAAGEGGAPVIEPPPGEAGFLDLEPYFFRGGPELDGLTTSSARLFYVYLEADSEPSSRPLFVFTGGMPDLTIGSTIPGPSTTGLFPLFGVSRAGLSGAPGSAELERNASSWSDLGNLLFIDGRQVGFSYSLLPDPVNDGDRGAEYAPDNYNNFVDAADFVRALLQFFEKHPDLVENPVVFVGQGYAGMRTSLMLSYLLYPQRLHPDADWIYEDEALADALLDFYDTAEIDAENAAMTFGWQILIQPNVGGDQETFTSELWCQPGTPELAAAEELDEACPPVSRDPLQLDQAAGWSLMTRQDSERALLEPDSFEAIFFVAPETIPGLSASERDGAYRLSTMLAAEGLFPKAPTEWLERLGALPDYDRYYIGNAEQLIAGNSNYIEGNLLACQLFVETAQHVATFVTNAQLDGRIRTESLPATLEDCDGWADTPLLTSITSETSERSGVARPGWLTLKYNDSAAIGATSRTIRWPAYASAGHLVSVTAPAELKQDVREFLDESGLPRIAD